MTIKAPTPEEIHEIARDLGLPLGPDEAASYAELVAPFVEGVSALDALPDGLPPVRYPRTPGARPEPEDNPLGAWYVRTRVEGAAEGPLAGRNHSGSGRSPGQNALSITS